MFQFGLISVRWQDFIDIALVAFITYRVIVFFVDTRAVQIVRGLLFALVILGASARLLDLRTLTWILGHLVNAFIIAIPVVFQPELRRLLEELGRGMLFSRDRDAGEEAESRAEGMIEAIHYLAGHHIGALIVFQRETGLKEIWRSAVHLKAEMTKELLISIFWPNNPLHDGAVIIDKGEIVAASCYLPLTDNTEISKWYGTRHRAAVGVTEVSDAQTLIVSEETGNTTLSVRGRLSRPLTDDQLAMFVHRYFNSGREQESRSFFQRIFGRPSEPRERKE